jgi:aminoglycoside/choline kinase family phosphotransferase/choline kinase
MNSMSTHRTRTAFILGAGLGTRLRPLTDTCPKPLLPVGGRPIITYAMDHLITAGIEKFIVNTHHCADVYHQAFPESQWRGIPIIFRHEPLLLDTAGGLKNIEDLVEDDDTIFVYNGDVIADMPLKGLIETHTAKKKEVTLALRSSGFPLNVNINENCDVCDLRHTLGNAGIKNCLFTGIYMVEKRFLRRLKAGRIESVVPVFIEMIREVPGSVAGILIDEGRWHDIGSVEEYERVSTAFLQPESLAGQHWKRKPMARGSWKRTMANLHHEMKAFAKQALDIKASFTIHMTPVARSGSNRTFMRIHYGDNRTAIFMHYDQSRVENNYYAAIAEFLQDIGVAVPRITAHDPERGFIVMEDLGSADLWSFRHRPWEVRRDFYRKTMAVIHRLHTFGMADFLSREVPLMGGFGPDLYKWERDYFYENFIAGVCNIASSPSERNALENELKGLSDRLENASPCLVHRDFQSRNVMMLGGNPVLIDFQGMRAGNFFYDLGSLLYDPYVSLTEAERMDLLGYYFQLFTENEAVDQGKKRFTEPEGKKKWALFREMFREASAQRLMQALGAYGFLGLKRGMPEFLAHIPNGIRNLIDATSRAKHLPLLNRLAQTSGSVLKHQDITAR